MMPTIPLQRRFVVVGARQMHYLRCGDGPPIVLVHPGIASAALFAPLLRRLAGRYTCFAFDNAGFGNSDPLRITQASMADLADALAEALAALQFPAVPVFGYHTGAAVALELAVRHPRFVSGVILEGLPIFTKAEVARLFSGDFAPPLIPDALGGHFASTWTRFRDQAAFYPWHEKAPQNALSVEIAAAPESIHSWVSWFFRSARHYAGPFRSAHTFGEVVAARLAALTVPGRYFVASNDLLSRHFDRFPSLSAGQTSVLIGPGVDEKSALIDQYLAEFAAKQEAPPDPAPPNTGTGIVRHYVDLEDGQVLVRSCGASDGPALLVLHDAPGSARALAPLLRTLGAHFHVIAPDLPGCGESDPLPEDSSGLDDYAAAMITVCRAFGAGPVAVYGIGIGACLALEFAHRAPEVVRRLLLRGVLIPTTTERSELLANYAPPIAIDVHGTHWYRTWLMLRDSLIYWPWYRRTRLGLRRVPADFSAERLHDWTFEVMKQFAAYPRLINAALRQDAAERLGALAARAVVVRDPLHPFAAYDAAVAEGFPTLLRIDAEPDLSAHAAQIATLLTG